MAIRTIAELLDMLKPYDKHTRVAVICPEITDTAHSITEVETVHDATIGTLATLIFKKAKSQLCHCRGLSDIVPLDQKLEAEARKFTAELNAQIELLAEEKDFNSYHFSQAVIRYLYSDWKVAAEPITDSALVPPNVSVTVKGRK